MRNLILQMRVFALEMNFAIDTINLHRGFCIKFTTHFKRGTFATLMQLNYNYFTIISAVYEKKNDVDII